MSTTGVSAPTGTPARMAAATPPSGWCRSFLERPRAEDARDLLAVEGLALEQRAGEGVQLLDVLLDDLAGAGGALHHDPRDLGGDDERGLLAVVLRTRHLAPEEDVLLVLAEGPRPELVGHAPFAHHLAGHLRRLLEVVARARRLLVQHDLLGGAAAEQDGDAVGQVLPRVVVLVVQRELLGEAQRAPARDDGDLVDGVGARQEI